MKILSLKLRIMVLWIFMAASITAEVSLYLYHKGQIEGIISGEAGITSANLVLWTIRWLIPFVLALLTISLADKASRILNIVFGVIIVVFNIFQFVMRFATGEYMPAFLVMIIVLSIVASILILIYAAVWPRYKE